MDVSITSPTPEISSGAVPNLNPRAKVRSACNRCHSQKLRCVRQTDQATCDRCLRLKTSCQYAPRARRSPRALDQVLESRLADWNEPPATSTSCTAPFTQSDAMFGDINSNDWLCPTTLDTNIVADRSGSKFLDLNYPNQGGIDNMLDMGMPSNCYDSMNLDTVSVSDLATISRPLPNLFNPYISIEDQVTEDYPRTLLPSPAQRVAALSVALYECASKFPSMTKVNASSADNTRHNMPEARKATVFVLDELFRLTRDFIDLTKTLTTADTVIPSPRFAEDLDQYPAQPPLQLAAYTQQNPQTNLPTPSTRNATPKRVSSIDEATMLMLISCQSRLTEIYTSVFDATQACLNHSLRTEIGTNWALVLPRLQMGSVAKPSILVDATTPLVSRADASVYMLMLVMVSAQLWGQVAEAMRGARDGSTGPEGGRGLLTETVWDGVMGRVEGMVQRIEATKGMLQRYSP